jgi:hypothetical protein
MRSICAYCKILFDVKPPYENDAETHGICGECFPIVMARWQQQMEERQNPMPSERERDLSTGRSIPERGHPALRKA